MPNFKTGDKVRVRLDSASPYRGRTGVIDKGPIKDSYGFWYMVKFEWRGLLAVRFVEQGKENRRKVHAAIVQHFINRTCNPLTWKDGRLQ